MPIATTTLPPFNDGRVLSVVEADGRMGVIDESKRQVWFETAIASERVEAPLSSLSVVPIPPLPSSYGAWKATSIGGISSTVRRVGVIRARPSCPEPITLFAILCPRPGAIAETLRAHSSLCAVGDEQRVEDDAYGLVAEVIVFAADSLSLVCALVAGAGAVPLLEDAGCDAKRCIGVERLDRIGAEVARDEATMYGEEDGVYGVRRGNENWQFRFLPPGWSPPLTWDHMVRNVRSEELSSLPQPLRQHVAKARLAAKEYPPIGSQWKEAPAPCAQERSPHPPPELRRVWEDPPPSVLAAVRGDGSGVEEDVPLRSLVEDGGKWYRPVDTSRPLAKHVPAKRLVSSALHPSQSKQIITAFYHLHVSAPPTPQVGRACALVLFHYLKERGYTARWVGKYEQLALHVGNGDLFRRFARLSSYAPHRLPAQVLNRLCGPDGKLVSRGSKGSRSKYRSDRQRYVPKRRLPRTEEEERRMASREGAGGEEVGEG